MKRQIVFIFSNVNFSYGFKWLAEEVIKSEVEATFIFMHAHEPELYTLFRQRGYQTQFIKYAGKTDLLIAVFKLTKIILLHKPKVVHTHLFDASLAGLIAAWLCRVPKRIHTRHHSMVHHHYHPAAVKYDKLINRLSTDIVAITKTVAAVLENREGVPVRKIHLIHHGFKFSELFDISQSQIGRLKEKYNPQNRFPVIGVIARYTHWKGIQYIIPAFKKILEKYPSALLVLANANGDYSKDIKVLLNELPVDSFIEIKFEIDIFALYKVFTVYVHVPLDAASEAFGQTYVEALAMKIPSVFTMSGVAHDFISSNLNALVVPYKDSLSIEKAVLQLLEDKMLCQRISDQGVEDVTKHFKLDVMMNPLLKLYE